MPKPIKPIAPVAPSRTVKKSKTIAESYGSRTDVTEEIKDAVKIGRLILDSGSDYGDGWALLAVEYMDDNPYYDKQHCEYIKKQAKYLEKLKKYEKDLKKWEDTREAREELQRTKRKEELRKEMERLSKELQKIA